MEPSWSELLRRVRWGNVAPFAVIVLAGAVLLLAPRTAPEPTAPSALPVQPGPAAQRETRPEVKEEAVAERPKARSEERREARTPPARSRRARKGRRPRRRRPARRPRPVAPAVPTTAPPPGPAWSPAPRPTPEQLEFAPLG